MSAFSAVLLGAVATTGLGIYIGTKIAGEKKCSKDDSVVFSEGSETKQKDSFGESVKKASFYAVGAVKTSAEKIAEAVRETPKDEMIAAGQEFTGAAKEKAVEISNNVKEKATSAGKAVAEKAESVKSKLSAAKDDVIIGAEVVSEDVKSTAENVKDDFLDDDINNN
ncbi:hypothetical protein FACS189499_02610 [Clostridia bacterium]|nr:hypothetical protein FACS189499_02610 [Clostridia bacterium]